MLILLFVLGAGSGILGGAVGVGGGIVLAPLLLFLPGQLGLGRVDMRTVAALTLVQSLAACFAGTVIHRRLRYVHEGLAIRMGGAVALVSFAAALASGHVSSRVLTLVFAGVAVMAAVLMLVPNRSGDLEVDKDEVTYSTPLALGVGAVVGALGGLVGQGGAFLIAPALLYLLRVPTRLTIGTSLAVALCAAVAGIIGKALSGQVPLAPALVLAAGALCGSSAGASLSPRISARTLRLALAVVVAGTAAKIVTDAVAR